jgi:hypothetical protein
MNIRRSVASAIQQRNATGTRSTGGKTSRASRGWETSMMLRLPLLALSAVVAALLVSVPANAANDKSASEISAPRRTQITVYPRSRYPGRYATRQCESWLAQENRPSGTVLTPQMRCWWR